MKQRTILVTGATSGIGAATTHALLRQGHRVFVHGRTEAGALAACSAVPDRERAVPVWADLTLKSEVRNLAARVRQETDNLDSIVNNAGKTFQTRQVSADGVEMTLAANVLAPFLLTSLLLPTLNQDGRVVTLAGMYHKRAALDVEDLEYARRPFNSWAASNQAQLAKVLFTFALARRFDTVGTEQIAVCIHPGAVLTNAQKSLPWYLKLFIHTLARPGFVRAQKGAQPVVQLASGDPAPPNGTYYEKSRPVETIPAAHDRVLQDGCWEKLSELSAATWS